MTTTAAKLLEFKGVNVWSIAPHATVYEAIARMADRSIGALLVLDDQRLAGIVTERDYARKVVLLDRSSRDTRVSEIMTTRLVTVPPTATIEQCMALMTEHRVRHLPVVDGDAGASTTAIGVISIGDVLRALVTEGQHTIDQLQRYIIGH